MSSCHTPRLTIPKATEAPQTQRGNVLLAGPIIIFGVLGYFRVVPSETPPTPLA